MVNKVKSFEDLFIWQESLQLCFDIYDTLSGCKEFCLRDQIQKSSVSVPSNIAEGFERETGREFIRFLYYARGSSGELRTQLYIAKHLKIIDEEKCDAFIDKSKRNASMIFNLIKVKKEKQRLTNIYLISHLLNCDSIFEHGGPVIPVTLCFLIFKTIQPPMPP